MKNRTLLLFVFLFSGTICLAQKKAVTETGDEVVLYQNGTWKYLKDFQDTGSISTNKVQFNKSRNSSFLLKSQNGNMGLWLNPKKWNFKKSTSNRNAEFELEFKEGSVQASILTESVAIPVESYIPFTIENGKKQSADFHITHKEYRIVNGLKVLYLQMAGTQSGIKVSYSGYYFSDSNVTVQFIAYTYQNAMQKYSQDVEELLNGLVQLSSNPSNPSKDDTNDPVDSISQGSLSNYTNCKQYFPGNWEYNIIDKQDLKSKIVSVERTLNKTYEFLDGKKYYLEFDNKWINDCHYELIFIKTNIPNWSLIKKGEKITVDILVINQSEMKFTTTFRGETNNGEMIKRN